MTRGSHVDTPQLCRLLCLLGIISIPMTFAGITPVF